nr:glycosyltransferase [Proteus mirabilis]
MICCTYNQEKYIEDTILGVLCQDTPYRYEFIIHDDCSTDSTSDIIKKYADNYPKIIKHIIPAKNIYSQGIQPGINAFSFSNGKYIALCEGDDFWIDEKKLTKQVDILENKKISTFVSAQLIHFNLMEKLISHVTIITRSSVLLFPLLSVKVGHICQPHLFFSEEMYLYSLKIIFQKLRLVIIIAKY